MLSLPACVAASDSPKYTADSMPLMQVAHANARAGIELSIKYFELKKQLLTSGLDGEQEQELHNKLNAVASKVASRSSSPRFVCCLWLCSSTSAAHTHGPSALWLWKLSAHALTNIILVHEASLEEVQLCFL